MPKRRGWKGWLLLLIFATPLVAKLISDGGWALAFILYAPESVTIRVTSTIISFFLALLTIYLIFRFVFARAWGQAVVLASVSALAMILPRLDFCAGYIVFKQNEARYIAALEAEPAASPRFKYFEMREFTGLAGGTFYYVVYDEAQEIGLPSDKQSAEWKSRHVGFTSAGVKGTNNPQATISVSRLEGNFFLVVENY